MAKKLQLRGGTTAQHASFTGAVREVTVDTDKDILVVHDGSTAGGFPAHRDLKGSDISSADPLVIVAGSNYFIVTGTTGFNDMTVAANTHFFLEFAGALVMTHVGGTLDLPSGAAITTAAGDVGEFFSTAANVVTCVNYTRASGAALVIANDSVNGTKIADESIDSEHYVDGSIDLAHLSADCVDGTKIADDAIDSEHYADGSIDNAHIADDAIDSEHYAAGSIDEAHLADNSVDSRAYVDASIDSEHLATGIILNDVLLKDYGEVTNALGDLGGGTDAIDLTAGNSVSATVSTGAQTFTFTNPTAGDELCAFSLMLTNGGSQTVNWPASVDFAGGTAPTLTTSGVDCLVFWTIDGGTIWNGGMVAADLK